MRNRKKILIFENTDELRSQWVNFLGKHYEVIAVSDEKEAFSKIQEDIEIVIIDIDLGKDPYGGSRVAKKIREKNPDCILIIVTAFGDPWRLKGFEYYDDFMLKPIKYNELKARIDSLFARKSRRGNGIENELKIDVIGETYLIKEIRKKIIRFANRNEPVLITGEPGTEKELIANALHFSSAQRVNTSIVSIDCDVLSLPPNAESELFGHVKGAFPGAIRDREGLFHFAKRGSIFLDEIGNLSLDIQSKIEKVLMFGVIRKIGGTAEEKVHTRLICATQKNLEEAVKEGKFREILYRRISVLRIQTIPLRERMSDIPYLVARFMRFLREKRGFSISDNALKILCNPDFYWTGNIRQLHNVIERAAIFAQGKIIKERDIMKSLQQEPMQVVNKEKFSSEKLTISLPSDISKSEPHSPKIALEVEGKRYEVLEGDGSKMTFPQPKYTPKTLEEITELVNKKDDYFIWINELTGEYLVDGLALSIDPKARESLCFLLKNFGFLCSHTNLMNKIGSRQEVYKYMSLLRTTNGSVLKKYIIKYPTEGYKITGDFKCCIIRRPKG